MNSIRYSCPVHGQGFEFIGSRFQNYAIFRRSVLGASFFYEQPAADFVIVMILLLIFKKNIITIKNNPVGSVHILLSLFIYNLINNLFYCNLEFYIYYKQILKPIRV